MLYQFNPKIHNLGNTGLGGFIHAEMAHFSTNLIDILAYDGRNVREEILSSYKYHSVLDLCCGVGISTAENAIGIDTSNMMITKAKKSYKNKEFYVGNAENYIPKKDIDIVTCMYAFHEMPEYAWRRIIENSIRIAKKEILIVDISPNYKPSDMMLSGEPYIENYLKKFDKVSIEYNFGKYHMIKDKVTIWYKNMDYSYLI